MSRNTDREQLNAEYEKALDDFIDECFNIAVDRYDWSWRDLARFSGLTYGTVYRLGMRETRRPQHRTVWLIARACGRALVLEKLGRKYRLVKEAV